MSVTPVDLRRSPFVVWVTGRIELAAATRKEVSDGRRRSYTSRSPARTAPALQKFYKDVFGWSLDTDNPGGYGMYRQDDGLTGGIGASQDGGPAT